MRVSYGLFGLCPLIDGIDRCWHTVHTYMSYFNLRSTVQQSLVIFGTRDMKAHDARECDGKVLAFAYIIVLGKRCRLKQARFNYAVAVFGAALGAPPAILLVKVVKISGKHCKNVWETCERGRTFDVSILPSVASTAVNESVVESAEPNNSLVFIIADVSYIEATGTTWRSKWWYSPGMQAKDILRNKYPLLDRYLPLLTTGLHMLHALHSQAAKKQKHDKHIININQTGKDFEHQSKTNAVCII